MSLTSFDPADGFILTLFGLAAVGIFYAGMLAQGVRFRMRARRAARERAEAVLNGAALEG